MPAALGDELPHRVIPLPVATQLPASGFRHQGQGESERHVALDIPLQELPQRESSPLLAQDLNSPTGQADEEQLQETRLLPSSPRSSREISSVDENIATGSSNDPHMNKRKVRSKRAKPPTGSAETDSEGANGDMNYRRKPSAYNDGDASQQVAALVNQESFNLDDEPPSMSGDEKANPSSAHGFLQLPRQDQRNFLMLVLLYFLQGIPMGLAYGSVPFLLKTDRYGLSYGQIGIFSLAIYPYSLKLLWSPIVDAVWSPKLGRRKSWILPVQVFSGLGMIWLGSRAEEMMVSAGAGGGAGIWAFTFWWFFLVFTCATQDIAVDGWALTLLSHEHIAYASTAQTVGLTGGQFMSYTVFLAFESPDFANRWFRSQPSDEGVMTLSGYLTFWGWAYLAVTIGLALFKREEKTKNQEGIVDVYKVMFGILKLKNIQTIIIIHLIAKIGFQANDAVTNLKLLDKGFSQEDLALTVLIDFPFELTLGYYAGKWSSTYPPMRLWCYFFVGRLVAAAFAQFVVMIFPAGGTTTLYLLTVIVEHVFSTFMSTVMFVVIAAFHAKISDPLIGGTYMTLLATVSNLGGTFPRYFVLELVDFFTRASCIPPTTPPPASSLAKGATPITTPFSCVLESEKKRCIAGGGTCNVSIDGYYIVNILCIIIGIVTFVTYIRPKALHLQSLPLSAWRIAEAPR